MGVFFFTQNSENNMSGKPNVLVLGGTGFIGRNLVQYLVENNLANKIRSVDKSLVSTSNLGAGHAQAFEAPNVQAMQATLTSEAGVKKAYTPDEGDELYEEKVFRLSEKVAKAAVEFGCKKFIEVSTAQVYAEGKKPSKEDAKLNPWTSLAKYKLKAEQSLKAMDGLPLV